MPIDDVQKIMRIYGYFKAKPGHVLISNHFLAVGLRQRWTAQELDDGIEEARRQGLVDRAAEGGWRLTEAGFRETAAVA